MSPLYGFERKPYSIVLVFQSVMPQSLSLACPAVYASKSCMVAVDKEVDKRRGSQVGGMSLMFCVTLVQFVWQGRGIKRLVGRDDDALAHDVRLSPPSDVTLRACLLRTDVRVELFFGRLLIDADAL